MIFLVFDTAEECDKFLFLYEKYKKTTEYTIKRFVRDGYAVDDLMQDIYLIIAKNLHKIDERDEIRTRNYIITITRNYCKSYLLKQQRGREDFMEDMPEYQNISPCPLEPAEFLMNKETYQALCDEIRKLDDNYRIAFELKYVNDLDDAQIAKIMGTTKKNIQMRIYRAKVKLRQSVSQIYRQ